MVPRILLTALLFVLLGTAYVKGYDVVKRRSPDQLAHFYLIMATVRLLIAATAGAIGVLTAGNRDDAIGFALAFIIMYVVTMVVTLWLRH